MYPNTQSSENKPKISWHDSYISVCSDELSRIRTSLGLMAWKDKWEYFILQSYFGKDDEKVQQFFSEIKDMYDKADVIFIDPPDEMPKIFSHTGNGLKNENIKIKKRKKRKSNDVI